MTPKRRHFAIATSTRADWGLLSPLAKSLRDYGFDITVIATNMHLLEETGMTVREIEADGFDPVRVPVSGRPDEIAAGVLTGFSDVFSASGFDAVIILGDRYEMVSAAMAAVLARIPIVHIAGGAVSYGAFDDCFRHAITKMAALHLTETDEYRRRIIQMGEHPSTVVTTGAIGVHNILNIPLMSREELEQSLGFELGDNTLLVTMHAATLSSLSPSKQLDALLRALHSVPDRRILFTYPNNDTDISKMVALIEGYAMLHPDRVHVVPSLGRVRYLSALQYVEAVVGNSSSGLVEVPSAGIPTLDIGHRQDGRAHGPSVVRCGETAEEIEEGLRKALSPEQKAIATRRENPYAKPDTLRLMTKAIAEADLSPRMQKKFYDL